MESGSRTGGEEFDLAEAMALLSRTPDALSALLRGLPENWVRSTEGDGSWSAFDIVGHLAEADREDWLPRVRWILEHGEDEPFGAFDRFAHLARGRGRGIEQVLDEFATGRRQSLAALESLGLQAGDLTRRGMHPALGSVTLGQLLATWAAHDLTHLHQLSRTLAHRYRDAVGPWSEYLGVLQCSGHGS